MFTYDTVDNRVKDTDNRYLLMLLLITGIKILLITEKMIQITEIKIQITVVYV